jgi:hypothetical protein
MKKQIIILFYVIAIVLFLSLPNPALAYSADLPLVFGSTWEYGQDGLWHTRQLLPEELELISDGHSTSNINTLSSFIYRLPDTSAAILAPWVVLAFDASRLTDPVFEDLTLKASAYTVNTIESSSLGSDAGHTGLIYKFAADNWADLDPNNPTSGNWLGPYGSWNTASSQDSPTFIVDRLQIAGRDISPDNLIWLKIGSGANISGGLPYDSVPTYQLTLNEISLSGDVTTVPLPGALLLLGAGLLRLAHYRRRNFISN